MDDDADAGGRIPGILFCFAFYTKGMRRHVSWKVPRKVGCRRLQLYMLCKYVNYEGTVS